MTSRAKLGFSDFDETEKQGVRAGAAGAGAPAAGLRPHEPLSREPRRRDQRHVEGRRRGALKELIEHATQRQFVYSHRWRVNDLVMWDDRCTMHRGMEFDDQRFKRDMRRATVSDVAPTCEQMGLAVAAE